MGSLENVYMTLQLKQNVDTQMEVKKRFTDMLYDNTSSAGEVNQAHLELFSQCGKTIEISCQVEQLCCSISREL